MEVVLTDRELDVMSVLWRIGSGTVAEVQRGLPDRLAYTTVLTVLRILEGKGYASHEEEGRAYRYHPLVEQSDARRSALRRLTRKVFSVVAVSLKNQLVSDRELPEDVLRRLRDFLDERLGEVEP